MPDVRNQRTFPGIRPPISDIRIPMPKDLKDIRAAIDRIDDQIIDLLVQRYSFLGDVVQYKQAHNLPAIVPERVNEVLERNKARAKDKKLNPELIHQIYRAIIDEYCRMEEEHLSK